MYYTKHELEEEIERLKRENRRLIDELEAAKITERCVRITEDSQSNEEAFVRMYRTFISGIEDMDAETVKAKFCEWLFSLWETMMVRPSYLDFDTAYIKKEYVEPSEENEQEEN